MPWEHSRLRIGEDLGWVWGLAIYVAGVAVIHLLLLLTFLLLEFMLYCVKSLGWSFFCLKILVEKGW